MPNKGAHRMTLVESEELKTNLKFSSSHHPHIVYGSSPRNASELRKIDKGEISSAKAKDFVEHLKKIHEEVRNHITKMNA